MLSFLKKLFNSGRDQETLDLLRQKAIIIDVRTKGEFAQGHVPGSLNIPLDQLDAQISRLKKQNTPIVACCATGRRSGIAAGILRQAGLTAINGGSWQQVDRLGKSVAASMGSST